MTLTKINYPTPIYEFTSEQTIDFELPIIVNYNVSKGYPETGPSFSCGGEPGLPDEVEDIEVSIDWMELIKQFKLVQEDPSSYGIDDDLLAEAMEDL